MTGWDDGMTGWDDPIPVWIGAGWCVKLKRSVHLSSPQAEVDSKGYSICTALDSHGPLPRTEKCQIQKIQGLTLYHQGGSWPPLPPPLLAYEVRSVP